MLLFALLRHAGGAPEDRFLAAYALVEQQFVMIIDGVCALRGGLRDTTRTFTFLFFITSIFVKLIFCCYVVKPTYSGSEDAAYRSWSWQDCAYRCWI